MNRKAAESLNPETLRCEEIPERATAVSRQAAEARRKLVQSALELQLDGQFEKALVIYDQILRTTPTDSEAAVEKGRMFVKLSRWQEAFNAFASVIDSNASNVWKAHAYAGAGEVLATDGQFEKAINATNDNAFRYRRTAEL